MIPLEMKEFLAPFHKFRIVAVLFLAALACFIFRDGFVFLALCFACAAAGGAMNTVVLKANGLRMPVLKYRSRSEMPHELQFLPDDSLWELVGSGKRTEVFGDSVRYKFLGDRFRIPSLAAPCSLGDLTIYFGVLLSLGQLFVS